MAILTPEPTAFDPVTLEVIWARLVSITEEMWLTVWRTAFSTIIGEAQDFGCELLDVQGNSLAHASRSMPVFNCTLPTCTKAFLERYPAETIRPGDILITNDPWLCAGHLPDIAIITPVFRGGRLVAFVGSIANTSDIGGATNASAVREVYEEGLQIPPLKLYQEGRPDNALIAMIRENVRGADAVMGDINAQIAANESGKERLLALMGEYGLEELGPLATVIQGRSEQAMREAISKVPDGTYRHAVYTDGLGEPLKLQVAITIQGSDVYVDWTGTAPQQPRGGINCTFSYAKAHSVYSLKCLFTPGIPNNEGCYRPMHVYAPEGCILNATKPMSVGLRVKTGWRIHPCIFAALAEALPDRVQAGTGLPLSVNVYGYEKDGRHFNDHMFQGGGLGASANMDGLSCVLFPTSAANVSVEMFENRTPMLVDCKEYIPNSGGAGRHRGGLGQRVKMRRLEDESRRVLVGVHPEGMLTPTIGIRGGEPGRGVRVYIEDETTGKVERITQGTLLDLKHSHEALTIELSGGGGYGPPEERDPALIAEDLRQGLVTAPVAL